LEPSDVEVLSSTKHWIRYRLPPNYIRKHSKPTVIGQKQKWFLLRLSASPQKVCLDHGETPEFDSWCWVDFWQPLKTVIFFKRQAYKRVLKEFSRILF